MFNWVKNVLSGPAPASRAADDASAHKRRGNALLDEGKWEQAEACYRQAAAAAPGDIDAWINLGYVLSEQKRYADAQQALRQALTLDAGSVDAHYMLGTMAQEQGERAEAIERFEQVIALKPEFERAYRDLFQALAASGQMERAGEVIRLGMARHPEVADFPYYLGGLHAQAGEQEAAIACFRQALALKPDFAEAWFQCGNAQVGLKRYEEALASYDGMLRLTASAQAYCNRGRALQGLHRLQEALAGYEQALRLAPDFPDALFNRGSVLDFLGRPDEALASYDHALQLQPDHADAWCNRGNTLRSLNRVEEALDSYQQALRHAPGSADTFANRGAALADLNRYEEALASYASALQLQPDHPGAHFNESLSRLLLGDFERGWKKYEWRWKNGGPLQAPQRYFAQPQWTGGEPLHGKTILLHAEQGLGDTIQFVRYAKLVADRGATVLLEAQPALQTLLANAEGVDRVLVKGQPLPAFDYHCPLLSLPLAFNTEAGSIPAQQRYLASDPAVAAVWSARLGAKTQPRVGLIWSGSTIHKNDRNRSIRLAEFIELAIGGVQFISLQKEVRTEDAQVLAGNAVAHFGEQLTDFSDTAGLISHIDLVISVDTSVAHLAAAMGKPVWLLLPANPDWRWMLQRTDSPWYPSMRLFRQPRIGAWDSVISGVARELAAWRSAG